MLTGESKDREMKVKEQIRESEGGEKRKFKEKKRGELYKIFMSEDLWIP